MQRFSIIYWLVLYWLTQSAIAADTVYQNGGVAIGGYDAVSYHRMQNPTEGSPELSHEWNGVSWLFASETNKRLFAEDPVKFAPRYGGYCAYAASKGALAPTEPDAWTIYHGKLYLNFSKSVRAKWLEDIDNHITSADINWPRLMNQ